jgi:hypothetical protein
MSGGMSTIENARPIAAKTSRCRWDGNLRERWPCSRCLKSTNNRKNNDHAHKRSETEHERRRLGRSTHFSYGHAD